MSRKTIPMDHHNQISGQVPTGTDREPPRASYPNELFSIKNKYVRDFIGQPVSDTSTTVSGTLNADET